MNLNQLLYRFEEIVRTSATQDEQPLTAVELHNILDVTYMMLLGEIYRAPCDHTGTRWTRGGKTFCGVCSREVEE